MIIIKFRKLMKKDHLHKDALTVERRGIAKPTAQTQRSRGKGDKTLEPALNANRQDICPEIVPRVETVCQ